jgi:dipeptidyl aminopeptidase/acylaminoacyl peptidase
MPIRRKSLRSKPKKVKKAPPRKRTAPRTRKTTRPNGPAAARAPSYGSWKSPLTADLIVAGTIGLDQVVLDGSDIYWIEGRPGEGGRNVVVRRSAGGAVADVTPPPFNTRTRVHEYGGGAYTVSGDVVYFSNFLDQRLYRQQPGKQPEAITPPNDRRYADAVIDVDRERIVCVCEEHFNGDVRNFILALPLDGLPSEVLVEGNDFYATPRLSPDGRRLAWLTWNHPNMPWDGTELWVGTINDDGLIKEMERVAGGKEESVFQPEWSPDGVLHFISDRTDWWNLYRWTDTDVEALHPMEAEFGRPQWVFGMPTYAFLPDGRIVCSYTKAGTWQLALLDTGTGQLTPLRTPYTDIASVRAAGKHVVFIGGAANTPTAVVRLNVDTGEQEILRTASTLELDAGYLTTPEAIEFPTEGGKKAHAFYYPPKNREGSASPDERPPLLVCSHGGPTSATSARLRIEYHFWTSRGFAVVDVNYGGSTGYGRAYRQRLDGTWGIVDVDDCVNAARYLIQKGLVDPKRIAIRGGSAGGYTTLCALTFRDLFAAGASYYGVSDLEALAKETHKFESRYLDRLIGPYPERRDLYRERSPIHFTNRLSCPVILFQGLEDKVVLPNQAEMMVYALRAKNLPVAYVPFAGEQHGFRKAENIKRALEGELYFYSRIFGFTPADKLKPVEIENLAGARERKARKTRTKQKKVKPTRKPPRAAKRKK